MFSYIGGKSKIGKWIKEFIPYDTETYVEGFSGAFWVFFCLDIEKYTNLKTVVYNDYNKLNANLFACVKKYEEFYEYLKDVPRQQKGEFPTPPEHRERFDRYQKDAFGTEFDFDPDNPNFELGKKYIYTITQVFSGSKPETSKFIDLKGKYNCKFEAFLNKLKNPKHQEFFKKITYVENMDFADVIEKYDSPTTYIYLDPPYWKTENYYSNHDFDREDHERLAIAMKKMKGKWALSYYYFDLLEEWFPKDEYVWKEKDFAKAAAAKKGQKQNMGTELLIMNYDTLQKWQEQIMFGETQSLIGKE
jgi:DNA adenine methylase